MNIRSLFLVLVMACFATTAHAQTFDNSVFHNPTYNDWGHIVCYHSFLMGVEVDLDANNTPLRREVWIRESGMGGQAFYLVQIGGSFFEIIDADVDDVFQIPFPNAEVHDIQVFYKYNDDPDGNGPIDQGDIATGISVSSVQPHPDPETQITFMNMINQLELGYTVQHRRYNEGAIVGQYYVLRIIELIDENGNMVWDDVDLVDAAGSIVDYTTGSIDMSWYPSGEYCLRVTLVKSHDWAGYQDFTNVIVDQTDGQSCEQWFNTTLVVPEQPGYDMSQVTCANGMIQIGGVFKSVRIVDMAGRVVAQGTQSSFDTTGWASAAYIVCVTDTLNQVHTKVLPVTHL